MKKGFSIVHSEAAPPAARGDGYHYVTALCEAIECYSSETPASAFEYRGATLRFAVERVLYFAGIDSIALRRLHVRIASGDVPRNCVFDSAIELQLARLLAHDSMGQRWRVRRRLPRVKSVAARAARIVSRPLAGRGYTGSVERSAADVLVHAIHPKFVRYLQPLIDHLPLTACYIRTPAVGPTLDLLGLPSAHLAWNEDASLKGQARGLALHRPLVAAYDVYSATLALHQPRCVILAEGNAPDDEIIARACHANGIPVICVQHGWSPIVHAGFRNMSYTEMLVWGDGFADALRPHNPALQMTSVGNYMLADRPVVADATVPKGIVFFLQGKSVLIGEHTWAAFLTLIGTTAGKFPNLAIRVREHAAYPLAIDERRELEHYRNVEIHMAADLPLRDVLACSFASVSIFSSTILESIAAGVPPLIANFTSLPSYVPDVATAGAGVEVKTPEAASGVLERWILEPEALSLFQVPMAAFTRRHFASVDGTALDRSSAAIMRVYGAAEETQWGGRR